MNVISKAPWNMVHGKGFSHEIEDANGVPLASVFVSTNSTALNDARLMAAAPYLLAACKAILAADEKWEIEEARDMVRAALMRAESDRNRFQPGDDLLKQCV